MSELGRLLVEARTAKELSLADVEEAIRVRQKYLEALEQGNYAALPPGAIARGFLRNYARYLDLDSAEILRMYTSESGDPGPVTPRVDPDGFRPIDYRPLEVTLLHEDTGNNWWRWVVALILVGALVAGIWWLLNNPRTNTLLQAPAKWAAAFGPQVTRTATATATRQRLVITVTPPLAPPTNLVPAALSIITETAVTQPPAEEAQAGPTPTSDLLTLPIPTVQPTPTRTPTPQPTATPEPTTGISLTLKTTQRAWTKITADGKVVMQDLLEAGQERGFDATQQMIVLTGNAGGVILTLNQENLGTLGNVGQVIERTWNVQGGQVSEVQPGQDTTPISPTVKTAPAPAALPPVTAEPAKPAAPPAPTETKTP
jgi:cytoskeleton protein RodZ